MRTAEEIAIAFARDGERDDLEKEILRHMKHHMKRACIAEREACAKVAILIETEGHPELEGDADIPTPITGSIRARSA